MKIKHQKSLLLVFAFILSTIVGSIISTPSVEAITCPNGAEYHDSDNKCYLKKSWAVSGDNGETCIWPQDTSYRGKVANGQCVAYKATNGTPTYDDGSPLRFSCPNGTQYHADRDECYQEKIQERQGLSDDDVGDSCDAGQGTDNKGYTGEIRKENGKFFCYGYKKTNDKPTVVGEGQQGQEPTPGQSAEDFCNEQFDGGQVAKCMEGYNGGTCAKYKPDSVEAQACQTGAASEMCNQKGAANPDKAKQELDCYWDVQQCFDQNAANEEALRKCFDSVRNIQKAGVDNYFKKRQGGDAGVCGRAKTNLITCEGEGAEALANVLKIVLYVLTVLVGVIAVGGIAYAATLYASAEDNSGQTSKAKSIIRDVVIGLFLYMLMVAIINWLIPGGVIG